MCIRDSRLASSVSCIVSRDSVVVLEEGRMAHGGGGGGGGFRASPKGGSVLIRKVEPGLETGRREAERAAAV